MKMIKVKRSKVKAKIEAVELKKKKLEDELKKLNDELNYYDKNIEYHKKWETVSDENKLKYGYNPELSFTCGMCRKEYNEGFDDIDKLKRFMMKAGNKWKVLSLYMLDHDYTSRRLENITPYISSCYKNTMCEICEEKGGEYDRFTFRTQRDRHFKKYHPPKKDTEETRECPIAS